MYDLLESPDCLPELLQGQLKTNGENEIFLLSSFKLRNKTPASLFSIINPKDNTKYLDLSVMNKPNKSELPGILPATVLSLSQVSNFSSSPSTVSVRYQRSDGRFATISFNHPTLANGQEHHVMLHASGLQRGPPRLNIYIECTLAHTVEDFPTALGLLPSGSNKVGLRTLKSNGQVKKRFYHFLVI